MSDRHQFVGGESGCVTPGVSHPLSYLAAVFPATKINIWASAAPEGIVSYSSGPLNIQEVTDTESLIPSDQPLEQPALRSSDCANI